MSLIDLLGQQLQGSAVEAIARQVGAPTRQTETVVAGALPMLVAGLSKGATSSEGASALAGALDRDHDGSVLDDLMGFVGGGGGAGAGILGHVFGPRQAAAEESLSRMSGLEASKVGQILALLAPLVMGALGRTKREEGLDPSALASLLGGERRRAEQSAPELGGLLGGLLDADGDGDLTDDVVGLGGKLLGSFLGGGRR